jgi:triosephosphate isomerase
MKNLYILGNWKANKTIAEAKEWIAAVGTGLSGLPPHVTMILCPAFHHVPLFDGTPLAPFMGVQDVSPFPNGAYTGEVSAAMVRGTALYALIGHSERRTHFGDTDEIVAEKTKQALAAGIRPVVCVSDVSQARRLNELVPTFGAAGLILYEPVGAIGSGKADAPENADRVATELIGVLPNVPILYGGSVVPENVASYVAQEHISGVGVGGASLDPKKFLTLVATITSQTL